MNLLSVLVPCAFIVLLLLCGAFFAATETAYTSLSRISVRQMLKENETNATKVDFLFTNRENLIATVLIGTNVVTTLISSIATAFAVNVIGAEYVMYATAAVSVLVIIFSEIIPKTYAAVLPKTAAKNSASAILLLQKLLFPLVWFFDRLTAALRFAESRLFKAESPIVTEEELKTLLELGKTEGTLEADEKRMLDKIFEFSDLQVHGIMKHRTLLTYVSVSDTVESVVAGFAASGHSRLPVCDGNIENVVGVLHYKAVLFASPEIARSKDFVKICMEEPLFVPETLPAVELLRKFKQKHKNFAVVVNEYGEMAGIVTLDDILREVFGRMTDESGMVEVSPEKRISVVGANEFSVPGDMKLDDLNTVLPLNLYSEYYDTLGGYLLERFDELPSVGAVHKDADAIFMIEDQSARRIQSVRIRLITH